MLSKIQFKRTAVAGKRPTVQQLAVGELAINLTDRTIFTSTGTEVIDLGFAKGGNVNGNINVAGQVTATHFNGTLNGLASRATTLATPRTISLSGDATGSVSFNGSSNVNISVTLQNTGVAARSYGSNTKIPTFTVDSKGRITHIVEQNLANATTAQAGFVRLNNTLTSGSVSEALTAAQGKVLKDTKLDLRGGTVTGTIVSTAANYMRIKSTTNNRSVIWRFDGTTLYLLKTADGEPDGSWDDARPFYFNLSSGLLTLTGTLNGLASRANTLNTPRTISLSGDATGSVSFNGSANVNIATTLANSGVRAGSYNSVTVDAKGRVTAGLTQTHGLVTATSATGTANVATTNNNTFLNIVASGVGTTSSVGSSTQVQGARGITVSSDTNGKLIIGQDLANNLNDTATYKSLTAAQGKILNDRLNTVEASKAPTVHTHTMSQITDYSLKYISTENLNDITGFGIYAQRRNSNSTAERNYPAPNEAGTLEVFPGTYNIRQRFTSFYSHRTFERSRLSTNDGWYEWTELSNTWAAIREKPRTLDGFNNTISASGYIKWLSNSVGTQPANTPFAISAGRIQGYSNVIINADTDSTSTTSNEAVLLTAARGVSSDKTQGLAVFHDRVTWLGTKTTIDSNGGIKIKSGNNHSYIRLESTGNRQIQIESYPPTNSSMGSIWYRDASNGAVLNKVEIPKHNGIMLTTASVINATNNTSANMPASANAVKLAMDNANGRISRTANETISGTKTFNGTINVPTVAATTNSTVAASTAFVKREIDNHTHSASQIGPGIMTGPIVVQGDFVASGNITAFSDKKLKTNIKKVDSALTRVRGLHGVAFNRIDRDNIRQVGLIAQDVKQVLPEAVREVNGILTVDYMGIIGLLVEAIKELEAR